MPKKSAKKESATNVKSLRERERLGTIRLTPAEARALVDDVMGSQKKRRVDTAAARLESLDRRIAGHENPELVRAALMAVLFSDVRIVAELEILLDDLEESLAA